MRFESIYHFEVINRIQDGRTVYIADRLNQTINCANDMKIGELVKILKSAKDDKSNRYDFWFEEKTEVKA